MPVTCNLSISADGFIAGPDQSRDNPLGKGGIRLHEWHIDLHPDDQPIVDAWQDSPGAYVMGRNMFGPIRGEWDLDWMLLGAGERLFDGVSPELTMTPVHVQTSPAVTHLEYRIG